MRVINSIVIHCSDSKWGCAMIIDSWHRARGWTGIGYHFVVSNGRPHSADNYYAFLDGQIEAGRDIVDIGCHAVGANVDSVGVCLIGKLSFTSQQLRATRVLITALREIYEIDIARIIGHYEVPNSYKTCPNIPMPVFRKFIGGGVTADELQEEIAKHNQKG